MYQSPAVHAGLFFIPRAARSVRAGDGLSILCRNTPHTGQVYPVHSARAHGQQELSVLHREIHHQEGGREKRSDLLPPNRRRTSTIRVPAGFVTVPESASNSGIVPGGRIHPASGYSRRKQCTVPRDFRPAGGVCVQQAVAPASCGLICLHQGPILISSARQKWLSVDPAHRE